jgi:hypothetical protein
MKHPLLTSGALSMSLMLALAGCGDESGGGEEAEAGESGSAGETGPVTDGEEPTTGEPFTPIPARGGIVLTRIEANPGVAVPIGLDGKEVGGPDRNAFIPKNRDLLVRAFFEVPDDWTPREIEARLTLTGGGVDLEKTQKLMVTKSSFAGQLESTFYIGVEAEYVVPNLKYQISLWEAGPGAEDLPEPAAPAVVPVAGPGFVGVESSFAEIRVVLVPIDYSYGSCNAVVDGEAHRKAFEDALFQQNAIENLEFTIHAPYKVTYDMNAYSGLSKLVSEMSQMRTDEGADPNVYYYGLFDNCGGCIGSGGGISGGCTVGLAADLTGDDESDARFRAAAGELNSGAAETFVHEIGHTQGRAHIECAGAGVQAAGTDSSYPYEDGRIGVWGFGVRDFRLRHPTANSDYMSYCGQTWASDWQWNATYQRIKKLSSWAKTGAGAPKPAVGDDGVLIGAVDPDGQHVWWTGPGSLSASRELSATHTVVFEFADGEVEAPAQVSVREHYPTRNIVARLPAGFDERELLGVRLRDEQGEHPVGAATIRRLHRLDRLKAAQ